MSRAGKFWLGGLGGLLPVMANLLAVDVAPIIDHRDALSAGICVGVLIHVILLVTIGGIIAMLNDEVHNPLSLVQLGIAAPALITSYVNGANLNKENQHVRVSSAFVSLAYAGDLKQGDPIVLVGGFLGDLISGLTGGTGAALDAAKRNIGSPADQSATNSKDQPVNIDKNVKPSVKQIAELNLDHLAEIIDDINNSKSYISPDRANIQLDELIHSAQSLLDYVDEGSAFWKAVLNNEELIKKRHRNAVSRTQQEDLQWKQRAEAWDATLHQFEMLKGKLEQEKGSLRQVIADLGEKREIIVAEITIGDADYARSFVKDWYSHAKESFDEIAKLAPVISSINNAPS